MEDAPMISQQYRDLNKTCMMTTPDDIPTWVEELSQGDTPR